MVGPGISKARVFGQKKPRIDGIARRNGDWLRMDDGGKIQRRIPPHAGAICKAMFRPAAKRHDDIGKILKAQIPIPIVSAFLDGDNKTAVLFQKRLAKTRQRWIIVTERGKCDDQALGRMRNIPRFNDGDLIIE
ncbi:hypothetical protein [Rhizobium sp. Root483D2]|uniref:hypothetical protein n=1 Tax=Rhizobium sp. Root483D2 TaxID=1736545 RepID=UPI0012E3A10F|nr:hypothetical protein [Rhizobium sp. Root483D2]